MAAGDSGKDPDTPTEPAWISIARQKQRDMHQEKELDREKLVSPDNESNTEKQNKGKEQTEVLAVQICGAFVSPPVVFFGSAVNECNCNWKRRCSHKCVTDSKFSDCSDM